MVARKRRMSTCRLTPSHKDYTLTYAGARHELRPRPGNSPAQHSHLDKDPSPESGQIDFFGEAVLFRGPPDTLENHISQRLCCVNCPWYCNDTTEGLNVAARRQAALPLSLAPAIVFVNCSLPPSRLSVLLWTSIKSSSTWIDGTI